MDASPTSVSPLRFLTRPQLKDTKGIGWSNPVLLRKEARGEFPKRAYLSPKLPVWLESEIDAWMRAKVDGPRETNTLTAKATATRARRRQAKAVTVEQM
jgi:predicted DNA-binding transcriptional regulator AlpA